MSGGIDARMGEGGIGLAALLARGSSALLNDSPLPAGAAGERRV